MDYGVYTSKQTSFRTRQKSKQLLCLLNSLTRKHTSERYTTLKVL